MRNVGGESRKTYEEKLNNGFFKKYMSGIGLDIGYSGYEKDVVSILQDAIGIDLSYPGYDGLTLPFPDSSQDYIYSSHVLEHILFRKVVIKDWFRVIKEHGYIITVVPHQFLYEKKLDLPSIWNGDHKKFFTPASLIKEFEEVLEPNSYRVRLLEDGDQNFDYSIDPNKHSGGQYEITLVIQKVPLPFWKLA